MSSLPDSKSKRMSTSPSASPMAILCRRCAWWQRQVFRGGRTLRSLRARLRFGEAALAHQSGDAGVAAAELAVTVGGIDGVAHREHVVDEPLRHGLVPRATRLDEGFPRV